MGAEAGCRSPHSLKAAPWSWSTGLSPLVPPPIPPPTQIRVFLSPFLLSYDFLESELALFPSSPVLCGPEAVAVTLTLVLDTGARVCGAQTVGCQLERAGGVR